MSQTSQSSKTAQNKQQTHGKCHDTSLCHAKPTVPGTHRLPVGLVPPKAVSSRVLQSWNLYKPNEWPWSKWAIRLEIEHIFTCRVENHGTGSFYSWSVVCFVFSRGLTFLLRSPEGGLLLLRCRERSRGADGALGRAPQRRPVASRDGWAQRAGGGPSGGSDLSGVQARSRPGAHQAGAFQPALRG